MWTVLWWVFVIWLVAQLIKCVSFMIGYTVALVLKIGSGR
jgi:hypothetical protein